MVAHTLYRHLKYSLQQWITEFLIKIWPHYIFQKSTLKLKCAKILQWLNFDWINKSRFSLNLERWKLQVKLKGKILQVNQFTPVGNTMDLFWLMHEVLFVEIVNILWFLVFVFGVFFHCQTTWIYLIVVEWGLWNNSWVKNLPVRPLAPRRKTPGQLYPAFNDLPGWVRIF